MSAVTVGPPAAAAGAGSECGPGAWSRVASRSSTPGAVGPSASGAPGRAVMGSGAESGARVPESARVEQRGHEPDGAPGGSSAPQPGQQFASAIDRSSTGDDRSHRPGRPGRGSPDRGRPRVGVSPVYDKSRRKPGPMH